MPNLDPILAATLPAEVPEFRSCSGQQIATLPGAEPFHRDSGIWHTLSLVRRGSTQARAVLNMATVTAIRTNP
ncbi:MAG: transposase [Chloroflexi bacterium]|nr:transposase [Chloroflexota bacterium]